MNEGNPDAEEPPRVPTTPGGQSQAPRRGLRLWLARALLAVASLGLSLGVAEVGVRLSRGALLDTSLLSAELRRPDGTAANVIAQYDSRLGWLPLLGGSQDGNSTYTIGPNYVRSNRATPTPTLATGQGVTLAVGDSFTFGVDVNDDETWPAHLEMQLDRPVLNAGVFSYGLDQSVLRAEQLISEVRPDVLLIGIIPEDVLRCAQTSRWAAKPYFVQVGGELQLRNVPVPAPSPPRPMDLLRRTAGYSHFADLVARRLAPEYWLDAPIEIAWDGTPPEDGTRDPEEIACLLMERVSAWPERPAMRTVLLVQYFTDLRHELVQPVLRCARDSGLEVLDLYEQLIAVRDADPEQWAALWGPSGHMTAHGNELTAAWIAAALQ